MNLAASDPTCAKTSSFRGICVSDSDATLAAQSLSKSSTTGGVSHRTDRSSEPMQPDVLNSSFGIENSMVLFFICTNVWAYSKSKEPHNTGFVNLKNSAGSRLSMNSCTSATSNSKSSSKKNFNFRMRIPGPTFSICSQNILEYDGLAPALIAVVKNNSSNASSTYSSIAPNLVTSSETRSRGISYLVTALFKVRWMILLLTLPMASEVPFCNIGPA
mmetsp:Transcript_148413/g.385872  ORF Transcript_148413/g.385872 Transcript_148413/m.385872 type:complete len:217 (-) Transcript_148413:373-1023(-)